MNRPIVRALLQDALYQVLDNRIFRLLMLVVLGLIAPTFLVAFRKDDVQVLWGWQKVSYEQLFSFIELGQVRHAIQDVQGEAIRFYEDLVVESLCGNFGMIFCVAATAFFVPRMLERGSADMLLSKPVSRATMLLSRYVSGILFVGLLTATLVVGMYLGFLVFSGYSDPGVLWGAVTLVYLFAIVHAVTILSGVVTRSTVASTLIALVFFMGTGCVHKGWRIRHWIHETESGRKARQVMENEPEAEMPPNPVAEEDPGTFWKVLFTTIDALHYTLPKTNDADLITHKLRSAIERSGRTIVDPAAHMAIEKPPEGFELVQAGLPPATKGKITVDLAAQPVVWRSAAPGPDAATIEITRRTRLIERPAGGETGTRTRPKRLTAATAAAEWLSRARESGRLESETTERRFAVDGIPTVVVGWIEKSDAGPRARQVAVLSVGDWIVEVSETANPGGATPDDAHFDRFLGAFKIARDAEYGDPKTWYEERFSPTAPLPFNLFFSIGSSIAFTLLMLVLAAWKLARIDF